MISSVTTTAAAEIPPGIDEGAGASRGAARPRAVTQTLQPSVGAAGLAHGATLLEAARVASSAPRPRPSPSGYAAGIATVLAAAAKPSAAAAKATSSSSKSSASKSSTAKKAGPLAFLDDPKLSMEEKLLRLLAYLNDKWNKDLDKKMKELKAEGGTATSGGSSSSGSTKPKSSGIGGAIGGLVSMAKSALPGLGVGLDLLSTPAVRSALSSVAGPGLAALATAAGMPELAPLALQYGPEIVDAAASVAKDASAASTSKPAASSGSSSKSSSSASADGIGSDRDAQLKLMEIQRIMDQQKEMFSLTSNLLKTGHDGRMAVIQNLR